MELNELRAVVTETEQKETLPDVEIEAIAEHLRSRSVGERRAAAQLLSAVAQKRPSELQTVDHYLHAGLSADDPQVIRGTVIALEAVAEFSPKSIGEVLPQLVEYINHEDVGVQRAAVTVLSTLSTARPEQVAAFEDELMEHWYARDPIVRAHIFDIVSSSYEHMDTPERAVEAAIDSLSHSNTRLRAASANLLSEIATASITAIPDDRSQIIAGMEDSHHQVRRLASHIFSEICDHDPVVVGDAIDELIPLLDDPDEITRQNSMYALLIYAEQHSGRLPINRIAKFLPDLLETEIVGVQQNAVLLTRVLLQEDQSAIEAPDRIRQSLQNLRTDPAIDIDDGLFAMMLDTLDTVQESEQLKRSHLTEQNETNSQSAEDNPGARSSDQAIGRTGHGGNQTKVFGDVESNNECPSCGREATDATFCPNCGTEL